MNPYLIVIGLSSLVICSYIFYLISQWIKIPSFMLLILTGIGLHYAALYFEFPLIDFFSPLNILGVIGLLMIVLEGALDLEIRKEKMGLILKAFTTAILTLLLTMLFIGLIFYHVFEQPVFNCALYAIPLSVVSSAIVIPTVANLTKQKKEFMVYESTFSDILGIMLFDFMIFEISPEESLAHAITMNLIISLVCSIGFSFLLVYLFQKVKTKIKLFLFISILAFLFAIGKYMHYSALLMVLIFGLVLENNHLFIKGKIAKWFDTSAIELIRKEFKIITEESSFLIRTFFFVLFGMTIDLQSLVDWRVILIGTIILIATYVSRFFNLKVFTSKNVFPELFLAPRGLITILLFYKIPEKYKILDFDLGILFFVILGSGVIMMLGMMLSGDGREAILSMDRGSGHSGVDPNVTTYTYNESTWESSESSNTNSATESTVSKGISEGNTEG